MAAVSSKHSNLVVLVLVFLALAAAGALSAQQSTPAFSKSFAPATIGSGSVSTLRFDIANNSASPVTGMAFTDTLPAGMTVASPAKASASCTGTVNAPEGGGVVTFSGGSVGGGSVCTVQVNVTASAPGTYTNVSGDLVSSAGNSGNATADLTVATDRPGFSKAFAPNSIFFGAKSSLTFTIDNGANGDVAANLTFVDSLPTGMVIASPAVAANTCTGGLLSAPAGGSVISYGPAFFGDASVAAGATCTVSVQVVGNAVGALGNVTGELTSTTAFGGAVRSSGMAGAVLNVAFERLRLTKSFTDDPVAPGGVVDLEFTVLNRDRDFQATGVTFSDDLDAVLSGLTAVGLPLADPCGPGSSLNGTSVISLTGGAIDPELSCTFSVAVQVPAAAVPGTYTNTTSAISGDLDGETVTGDPATDDLFVAPVPILTKEFTDDPVGGGGSVTLEFSITNTSATSSATDITFVDEFDEILPSASDVPANGFCGAGAVATYVPLNPAGFDPARLTVTGASLAPGGSCTFSLTLDVAVGAAAGSYPNVTTEISAIVDGEAVTGAPASDDLDVVGAPELTKEFIDDPIAAGGTGTLRFTLSLGEESPGDAESITFSDNLDATLAGLIATGLPLSDVCGAGSSLGGTPMTILLTDGVLAPGDSCTFDVDITVPAGAASGIYTNVTSTVSASVLGVATSGPAATADLRIAGLTLTKEFTDDPVLPGGVVNLQFTVENTSAGEIASAIAFSDNLDVVIDNMSALGLPLNDVCGVGSSLTAVGGNTVLVFQGGSLGAGELCAFDVDLQVPASAEPGTYTNTTSAVSADIGGSTVLFDPASDEVVVSSDFLSLTKEFIDDPVAPGDQVTLQFTITNLDPASMATDIAFTDDLEAALTGLVSASGVLSDVCGVGSQIAGTDVLTFSGGSLAGGASCFFDVVLDVPSTVAAGEEVINVTSTVTGVVGGFEVTGDPAIDSLEILFVDFSKAFSGTAGPGDTVQLSFTLDNLSASAEAGSLAFSDDLQAVIPGLVATGLPIADVCGAGSQITGTSFLVLTGGNLLTGGSCTFSVDVVVPLGAAPGDYLNVTSELSQFGLPVADPATATLTVIGVTDTDGDGVDDGDDYCPDTVIPESVPTIELKPNRYALVDDDFMFDTPGMRSASGRPAGLWDEGGEGGGQVVFTTTDTAGCSCEQIIEELGLGNGHTKFGCSVGAMRSWVDFVNALVSKPKPKAKPRF